MCTAMLLAHPALGQRMTLSNAWRPRAILWLRVLTLVLLDLMLFLYCLLARNEERRMLARCDWRRKERTEMAFSDD